MKHASLVVLLVLATSPVAAQTTTSTSSATSTSSSAGSSSGSGPSAGTICSEMITATFCNEPTSPNTTGYGSNGGAGATSSGITTPSPSTPSCGEGIVADNELCN